MKIKIKKILKIKFYSIILIGVLLMAINQSCSSAAYVAGNEKINRIESSENYRKGKFYNHVEWKQPSAGEYFSTMWEFLFGGNRRTPEDSLPVMNVNVQKLISANKDKLMSTWLGHSSLIINIDGNIVLTDPVFEKKVSLFGPTRYNGESPLNPDELPGIDVVIISHNHYDHLNKYSIKLLKDRTKRFVVPLGVGAQLEDWDVPSNKITELDWWEETDFEGLMIAATPSQHFSGRGIFDRDETLWASWVIEGENHKIFFSGDSGYFEGFKQIGNKFGPFDMTFLECGAYNEKWHHIHMYPEETVKAHLDLKGAVLHPIHWGTFNLSLHPWYEPMVRFTDAAWKNDVDIAIPVVGETMEFNAYHPKQFWWETKEYLDNEEANEGE